MHLRTQSPLSLFIGLLSKRSVEKSDVSTIKSFHLWSKVAFKVQIALSSYSSTNQNHQTELMTLSFQRNGRHFFFSSNKSAYHIQSQPKAIKRLVQTMWREFQQKQRHVLHGLQQCFIVQRVQGLDWPASSPDLSPTVFLQNICFMQHPNFIRIGFCPSIPHFKSWRKHASRRQLSWSIFGHVLTPKWNQRWGSEKKC